MGKFLQNTGKTLTSIVLAATLFSSACGVKSDVSKPDGTPIGLKVSSGYHRGSAIAMADMNKDGQMDILAANAKGEVFLYIKIDDGYVVSTSPISTVPFDYHYGSAIAAGDFDGDGDVDILATDKDGNIYLYENK